MKKIFTLFSFLMLSIYSGYSQDIPKKSPVKFLLAGALELGGDEVAIIIFDDGSEQKVVAGQGGTLSAGIQIHLNKKENFALRSSLGIKYVTTKADNANIRLTRIPIHLTAHYFPDKNFRIGAGLVTHQSIRYRADGIGPDIDFKGAIGPVVEVAFKGIGLSYTIMTYTDESDNTYSANAIGLTLSGVLGKK